MASTLGTDLPRKPVAWFWFVVAALPAIHFTRGAYVGAQSWALPAVFFGAALLIFLEPRLRKPGQETVQVDESGVLRVEGSVREQIHWNDITEIRIITTNEGPYREDVFVVLAGASGSGCAIPHDAAVRTKLLEELQTRFPSLDNEMVIKAMGSTSNNNFLVWKRPDDKAA
jgi:hypothetical protein